MPSIIDIFIWSQRLYDYERLNHGPIWSSMIALGLIPKIIIIVGIMEFLSSLI